MPHGRNEVLRLVKPVATASQSEWKDELGSARLMRQAVLQHVQDHSLLAIMRIVKRQDHFGHRCERKADAEMPTK